jgi:hypothetical protein
MATQTTAPAGPFLLADAPGMASRLEAGHLTLDARQVMPDWKMRAKTVTMWVLVFLRYGSSDVLATSNPE